MTINELLAELTARAIQLRISHHDLIVRGRQEMLDPSLINELRTHKATLLTLVHGEEDEWWNPLPPLMPEMLPLVELTEGEIEEIVRGVPGGAANVQDIYPLAPLQEGILFHHLMGGEGDPYLLGSLLSFDTRERLDGYLRAMQAVIERHDILRTGVMWEGLREPVQVVWRKAVLAVEEVALDPAAGEVEEQLYGRFDPRRCRIDVRQAPMLRVYIAWDKGQNRWLMMELWHHLIGDHSTVEVMQEEIGVHLRGRAEQLPAPLPFRNLVAQARLGVSKEEHEAFFRKMLGDVAEPTAPFGVLDVQGDGTGIEEARMALDATLARRLRVNARRLGVSAASLCHLAWAQVLGRVSGREDVVFGTVLFGRMQGGAGSDRVMGLFINTLPVRIRVGEESVETCVRRTHALLAELMRHEHASLALAQRCSAVPAPAPLFSALLNYRHSGGAAQAPSEERTGAWEGIQGIRGEERTSYPFTLSVDDLGVDGFGLTAQTLAWINPMRICEYMRTALESLVTALETAPSMAVRALAVLPATERHRLLYEWNDTRAEFPSQQCIQQLYEEQVRSRPEATAVVYEETSLTYGELNRRANRLAHYLRGLGVKPDARVAICVDRSLEMVVGLLAVLKAGGAYVPLDPAYPVERLRFMLEDCAPVALLTQGHLQGLFSGMRDVVTLVDLSADPSAWSHEPDSNLDCASLGLTPEHLAYVIYTSGSTGTPKGVMVEHRNLTRLFVATDAWFHFSESDIWTLFHSYAFDFSVWEIWGALLYGGRLMVVSKSMVHSPEDFYEMVCRTGVTVLNQTPSAFRQLTAAQEMSKRPHQLRYVIFGGEALEVATLKPWYAQNEGQHTSLVNMYGITETTVHVTYRPLERADSEGHRGSPIGCRILDLRIYILGEHGEPVPVGVVGELYIGGAGVARGYLNRPELTAERFVKDPFVEEVGARMYKTGDMGRWRSDGTIEFVGRNDFQVKIRGFRIELGEIEARLAEQAGVREAVVMAREDTVGDKRLVAYYTAAGTHEGDAAELGAERLRGHLLAQLPEYMVPAAYVRLKTMPLTPNGKLDRKALPAPEADAYGASGYEAPQGEIEAALAVIWGDVLKVDRVGRHDNFFALGGHSLLAVRMVSRIRQELGVEVAISDLFARPTLADFVQGIASASHAELPVIRPAEGRERLPLSFAQQRLWFLAQMKGVSEAYHIPLDLRLRGELDQAALRRALDRIIARHEVLRTIFVVVDEEPVQRMGLVQDSFLHLVEHDLRQHNDAQAELDHLIAQEASSSFDLEKGPLIRGRLIRQAAEEHVLLITMHHIVFDGWSMGIFLHELSTLYAAFLRGEEDPLPNLEVQYADYAVWQRQWMVGEILQQQAEYWRTTLHKAPELLEVPADHVRPAQQDYAGAFVELVLNESLTKGLQELSRRHGATLFMTVLSGWAALLGRLSGQPDVVIGIPVANRGRVEIEGLIGFFVNTLALCLDLSGSPTVSGLLERVKVQALAAQQHQDIPFEQVVEIAQPVRSLSHSPLFQVAFAWQNAPQNTLELPGLKIEFLKTDSQIKSKFDLTLSLGEEGGRIVGGVEYATSLFERSTIERYIGHFRTLLEAMVANDTEIVDRLPLLNEQERYQVLYEWNDTRAEFPSQQCIQQLYEEQVRSRPEATAVVYEETSLTYGELNRRANRLAHYLRGLGVKPDARVAICVDRSLEMVVGLLAVLKAGGAYVPLDPAYPVERLRFMLEDCAPVALLTQGHLQGLFSGMRDVVTLVDLSADPSAWSHEPDSNLDCASLGLTPEHLAYVIYTSGSTGTPKGVMVEHRNLTRLFVATDAWFHFSESDIWTLFHSYAFDFSVWEIWGALLYGGRLMVVSKSMVHSPEDFYEMVCRTGVTVLNQTPSAFRQLTAAQEMSKRPHQLRYVIFGGEALEVATLKPWYAQNEGQHTSLVNMYGITETTVHVTYRPLERADSEGHRGSPIGCRILDLRIYILGEHGEPVPVGVVGELYIGGAGVARGYLNRPELTAERFVKDPFVEEVGARMYKTGDMGRWRSDGTIEFVGRNDFQVKIRGFRIELGEIEARLAEQAGVREAVVMAREDTVGDKRLVAYYTAAGTHEGDAAELGAERLRGHLLAQLPEYMVPAAYVRLKTMPLTPNGKLDRKALPAPEADAYGASGYEAPQGEIEAALAVIWGDVLKVDRVGRHDNFFALGGHSLLAVTLIERMRRRGLQVDVRALFATSTLAELAASVEANANIIEVPPNRIPSGCTALMPEMLPLVELTEGEIEEIVRGVPGGAANVQDIYPLAPLQEGILFHHLMGGEGDPYLLGSLLSFDTRERLDGYLRAMQAVIERHDILRTGVMWEGLREPVQVVWRKAVLAVEEVALDPAAGEVEEQLYGRFDPRRCRIDVRQAPMLRVYIAWDKGQNRWLMMELWHHLIGDHSTVEVMQEEIGVHLRGRAEQLPAPLPFRNLVAQARLGVSKEEHEAFFRKMLGDVAEPTAPFGVLDVQGDGTGIEEARMALDATLARRLRVNARRLGVSAASLCHLAWAQVLGRVSGREDVVFGTVLFGRMQGGAGSDRVMGLFINTLPVRIRVGEESVETCVRRTHALLAELMRHEHASLALAQRCSAVPAPAPLFSALLNYRHSGGAAQAPSEERTGAWEGIQGIRGEERTSYPFTLSVDDLGVDGFGLTAQTLAWINPMRICEYMRTALESLVTALETAPSMAVRALAVLPATERHRLLYEWNDTRAEFPSQQCIQQLYEEQVRSRPEATAVVYEETSLTYGELNRRANRLAHYLRGLGVKPDARVAICVDRSLEMVVGLLAVLKAGGAYVPLDPAYPVERLRFMLEDCAPVALLTQGHLQGLFSGMRDVVTLVDLSADPSAWSHEPDSNLDCASLGLTPEHLAYVIYTSGSTGTPKGVMVEHRGLCNLVVTQIRSFAIEPDSRVLQFASFSFDACVSEILITLCQGASLYLPPQGTLLAGDALTRIVAQYAITHVTLTPAVLADLSEDSGVDAIRTLIVAGDVLTDSLVKRWIKRKRIINAYGPTEATVCATLYDCHVEESRIPPIGKPIANSRIYILGEHGEPVPVGVVGELYIGGAGVARGYLNRPELTAERFVKDPFVEEVGARMYKTGDMGRWRSDGTIEFVGRNDFQVKIRGFRIELGEIEARLAEQAGVREAVVMAREDTVGDKRLVAYYTAAGTHEGDAAELGAERLRGHLLAQLPEYMVPAAYVRLKTMPLTPNGKLDRKALPAPEADAYGASGYEAPQGEIEAALAVIWGDVLKVDRVGRHDNFFALGGHSLLAVRMVSRIRQDLGVEVAISDLFARPTLADFVQGIASASHAELPVIRPAEGRERLPLSFAQQRLWFLAQMKGVSEAYHIPLDLRLRGELDQAALRRALDRIIARHEVLRTIFVVVDEEPVQRMGLVQDSFLHLVEHDLRQHNDAQAELDHLIAQEASSSFDLEKGPLIRGRLIRQAAEEHVLLITMHHIVFDGWSMGIFLHELSTLYAAFLRGEEDPLPNLEVQYADYAVWQRQWMVGEILQQQAEYWRTTLHKAPELLEVPADHVRPAQQDYAGAFVELVLNESLTKGLQELSRRHGATLFMTVLSGWAALLGRLSGQPDVVIGIPVANRGRVEIEGLIGFFVNTLALCLDLSGSPTVSGLLERVKVQALAAQQHQDIPFEQVVEIAQPVRSLSHSPLFQVAFAWQNAPQNTLELPGLKIEFLKTDSQIKSKFDLTLSLGEEGGRIVGGVEYATSLFERSTIERYIGHFRTLLEAMVANDTEIVDRLPLLNEQERYQVLYEWNDTRAEFPSQQCIQQLYEEQVRSRPEATAVVYEETSLTYGELNRRANRLAHYLRGLGVKPDARVAICVDRSLEMVVGLLAVLKAGGAYVPLDPAYPVERLRFMLEDCAPVALLTQGHLQGLFSGMRDVVTLVDLSADPSAWSHEPDSNLDCASLGLTPEHLAYVIYTSGSTGTPKGVMVEHRNLVNLIHWQGSAFALMPGQRSSSVAGIGFDAATWEIWPTLCLGAALILPSSADTKDIRRLLAWWETQNLDLSFLPTPIAEFMFQQGTSNVHLHTLLIGGDRLHHAPLYPLPFVVINNYGPTEATVVATSGPHESSTNLGSIGKPIANSRIYILGEHGEPVPVGVVGELYIGGAGVARGYLNRPELTAERFVKDPFVEEVGARMYKTGDMGRWRSDGTIEFVGRNDFQVKIRGFRIELGEIEARLAEQAGVREAVVMAREDTVGDKRLVAYYTAAGTHEGDAAELGAERLRGHLLAQLPEYMVPAAYVRLKTMPLTPNGKLDRKALPAPEADAYGASGYEAPQGEIEAALAVIWGDVLKVDRVGRHDNFFALGGHSLLAVTLIERMRRRGLQVDVRALFATSTLAELAASVEANANIIEVPPNRIPSGCTALMPEMLPLVELTEGEIEEIVRGVPGGAANVQDIYPLAPLQEGILFHHLMGGEGDPYLLGSLLSFDTRERLDGYLRAMQAVIERHDILRTGVMWEGLREPVQVVWRKAVLAVEEVALDPAAGEVEEQLYGRFDPRRCRIDVRQAPMLRVYIAWDKGQNRWLMMELWHHLIGDHSTVEVMQEEIGVHLRGRAEQLPAPLPFRNLVAQARLGVSKEEHEAFFRKMLGDVAEPTAPFGVLDVQGDGTGIEEARMALDATLARRLRVNARRLGVSAASLCHLAWAQVLGRVSGREDVVFGTVLFGRMQGGAGSDRVMGLFINTLPVRIRVGEESVETCVRRTHALLAELMRHEHASLALAQRCSAVPAPAPLFSALLNYRHSGGAAQAPSEERTGAWEGIQGIRGEERTSYPFTLSVDDLGVDGFGLTAQTLAWINPMRICEYMRTALESLVTALETAPSMAVRALAVLPATERHRLLYEWNDTRAEFPSQQCIQQLYEEQVRSRPEATAVVYEETSLTYGELNRRANRLAHYLRGLGVKPDARVAICVDRSLEMVVGLLAVLKAGGAYVPLDPAYPVERLRFMLEDCAPVALLTQGHLQGLFSGMRDVVTLVDLSADPSAWSHEPDSNLDCASLGLTPEHLAYVIYTSGSTGTPKGVMVEHRNTVNLLYWGQSFFVDGVLKHTLFSTSLNFDLAVFECFLPLTTGAVARLVRNALDIVHSHSDVTLINTVPSAMSALLEAEAIPRTVRVINLAGEVLRRPMVEGIFATTAVDVVCNLYGPSETTTYSSWVMMKRGEPFAGHIGKPIANSRIYILGEHGEPVPVGVVGELYIGGAGVARGYLNRPELTAERFVKDPFVEEAGARMYKTGDMGRWRSDGTIEFVGRNDFQVKIRGFRIELGEIEARLAEQAGVREAVVMAREDTVGDKRLVAYYTAAGTHEGDAAELGAERLRGHLLAQLPEYMVPAAYVRLKTMPLTPNGKLDRKALPAPEADAYGASGYEAPQGEIEAALAVIWGDVLKVDRVGRHDNFFALGGHSLLAVTLIERMRRRGLQVDVRALFATSTLAELAASVEANANIIEVPPNRIPSGCTALMPEMLPLVELTEGEIEEIVRGVPGGAANVQDIYPLAPLQEGILFHHLMGGEGDPYLLGSLLSFDTRERLDGYLRAMQAVIERHDILRTGVMWEGLREPVQVVWRKAVLAVEEVALDPAAGEVEEQLYGRFDPRRCRIDVRQAPMLRVYIAWDKGQNRWLMMELWHHLIGDHSTVEVMQEEIGVHLRGRAEQLPAPLPFRNLVAQARLGVSKEEHEAFFRKMLGDVAEPTAPFGVLDVQGDGTGIEEARMALDATLARRLRVNARRLGVSAASLCHLAWAQVLGRVSGREDVVFGTVLFGRMQGGAGSDRVMGLFINTLPVRIRVGEESVETCVRRTHALLAELMRHEHASLALAQRCSAVPAPAPLFSALLNYRHSGGAAQAPSEERTGAWEGIQGIRGEERTSYPFTLSVDDLGVDGFGLTAQTLAWINPMRICEYMRTALESLVTALETAPSMAVRALAVLPATERHRLLYEWNDTRAEFPSQQCIQQLYEEQVRSRPEATAVVYEETSLTYGELNRRANRLAHYLRGLGVKPDARVAICVDRSLEMVVGLLAVLKAGGAYVPLDPAYPVERLRFMLEDCAPVALLTQGHLQGLFSGMRDVVTLVDLSADPSAWSHEPDSNLDCASLGLTPEHLAYVIYTSGSTGTPKGVMVEHRNLVNLIHWQGSAFALMPGQRSSSVAGIGFDAATWEIWPTLCLGAALILPSSADTKDIRRLLAWWETQNLDLSFLPTPIAEFMFQQGTSNVHLHTLLIGGDRLHHAPLYPLPFVVINNYGPTEATVVATSGPHESSTNLGSIGKPIANSRIYILGEHGEPVPVGVVGELYIGGAGVARGYLNRPELTAERFVKDPFVEEVGARMYKTGDMGRWRSDGTIEFVGRNDFQVKIRGFRIELGEIEARLAEQAGVREAVVMAREDTVGDKRLVAYYTAAGTHEGDAAELGAERLRGHLLAQLPEYMVPAAYVRLKTMPLTPNGKLDRKALPAPEADAYGASGYEAPQGEIEAALAVIWGDVLKVDRVGRHDNFFALGGHSLLAVRMVSRIRQDLGVEVAISDLFARPTIKSTAAGIPQAKQVLRNKAFPIRETGLKAPIFMPHCAVHELMYPFLLAPHIDSDIPVYGLPSQPSDESQLRTVEGMAARMIKMIREVQPIGPYRVAGWSFGGTLAYEIATQLIGSDQKVEFLGVLDTSCDSDVRSLPERELDKLTNPKYRFLAEIQRTANSDSDVCSALDEIEFQAATMDFAGLVKKCQQLSLIPAAFIDLTVEQIREFFVRSCISFVAKIRYRPQPIPVPIHLFVARENNAESRLLNWNTVMPESSIRIIEVPGNHHSMFARPNIYYLGKTFSHAVQIARHPHPDLEANYSPLVPLKVVRENQMPLFCVPGAGDNVSSLLELVDCLDLPWTIYGLQPRGVNDTLVPHSTVRAAAECNLNAIEIAYPRGPVHLLGHSFGGWVVFEMAQRLIRAGRTVASLTILDSDVPDEDEISVREYNATEAIMAWIESIEQALERKLNIRQNDLELRSETEQIQLLHQRLVKEGILPSRSPQDVLRGPTRAFAMSIRANYKPSEIYSGSTLLILVDESKPEQSIRNAAEHAVEGWRRWAPNLICRRAFGNHMTILKMPHVLALSRLIQAYVVSSTTWDVRIERVG